jgi:hypothetical protein
MEGFCDQIARQYDTLVVQTQIEPTISSEGFVTPNHTDLTNSDSWLEFGEFNDETLIPTNNSATTQLRQSAESGMEKYSNKHFYLIFISSRSFMCCYRRK